MADQDIEDFKASLRPEPTSLDDRYAHLIQVECGTTDWEANAGRRDGLIAELLRELGMHRTLAAYRLVEIL